MIGLLVLGIAIIAMVAMAEVGQAEGQTYNWPGFYVVPVGQNTYTNDTINGCDVVIPNAATLRLENTDLNILWAGCTIDVQNGGTFEVVDLDDDNTTWLDGSELNGPGSMNGPAMINLYSGSNTLIENSQLDWMGAWNGWDVFRIWATNVGSFLSGLPLIGDDIQRAGQSVQSSLASIGGLINPALEAASNFLEPPVNDLGNIYGRPTSNQ